MTKKRNSKRSDPHATREASRYSNPIPSREFIIEQLESVKKPLNHQQIMRKLELTAEDEEPLRRRLRAMERDGQLVAYKGKYRVLDRKDLLRGHVVGHRDGFGFVVLHEGGDDLYLHHRQMTKVFDGDEVLVRISGVDRRGRQEAAIVEVTQRNTHQVVGRIEAQAKYFTVTPDNSRLGHRIIVPKDQTMDADHGQFVVVDITEQPREYSPPSGKVCEIIGDHLAPGMATDIAIRSHDIPFQFPDEVIKEAEAFAAQPSEKDKQHRVDLRKLPLVTIDGEDARDFDDAVYCEAKKSGGWKLYVAIADVSHYVKVHSALDKEAFKRGTSVYFPDRVVPMLPEALSNGLCSLVPDVDRLCMVCEMSISAQGRMSRFQFYEGVLHSHARLTYNKVAAMLNPEHPDYERLRKQYAALVPHIEQLHALYKALRETRTERGAIDFETTETRIQFGADQKVAAIVPVERNDAHRLIEECMLCANVATARFLLKHNIEGLFRVHDGPSKEKLENLRSFLGELGLDLRGGQEPTPGDYQQLLEQLDARPDRHIIQTMMLRSMSQAMYQPENRGHFGLAYPAYTHFTSPIRRYPDLMTHRAIRSVIRSDLESTQVKRVGKAPKIALKNIYPYDTAALLVHGEHCSSTERRADDASRDVVAWLKCEYLQDRVGEIFPGVISAVTGFGLFVELTDLYVEGLVHISNLQGDYFQFDAASQRLLGERTRQVYSLGDPVTVCVARVDLDERQIDLELVDSSPKRGASTRRKQSKPTSNSTPYKSSKDRSSKEKRSKTSSRSSRSGRRRR